MAKLKKIAVIKTTMKFPTVSKLFSLDQVNQSKRKIFLTKFKSGPIKQLHCYQRWKIPIKNTPIEYNKNKKAPKTPKFDKKTMKNMKISFNFLAMRNLGRNIMKKKINIPNL